MYYHHFWTAFLLLLLNACGGTHVLSDADFEASAERFFRGIYGCNASVIDELANEDIIITYPIFEQLFNTPALSGREAVKDFATGFCSRWTDAQITIHEAISEQEHVVLVWSFRARNVESSQESSWGGITVFRFNEAGEIVVEYGEESDPGPIVRLGTSGTGE